MIPAVLRKLYPERFVTVPQLWTMPTAWWFGTKADYEATGLMLRNEDTLFRVPLTGPLFITWDQVEQRKIEK